MKKFLPVKGMNQSGQVGLPQVLSLLIILFVVFTVGRILFNATSLDPDSSDGGINAGGAIAGSATAVQNPLTNIGFIVMGGIILIGAMASIVIRFF